MRNVHTSSQNRYVASEPCETSVSNHGVRPWAICVCPFFRATWREGASRPYLKRQARLDIGLQLLGDGPVEVGNDLHRQLRIHAGLSDEIVERVRQREADAVGKRNMR